MTWQDVATNAVPLLLGAVGGGLAGAVVYAATWWIDRQEATARDLLRDALSIMASEEAWLLDGAEYKVRALSENRNAPFRDSGHPVWLRHVEVRAALDPDKWSAPSDPFFGFVEGRRVWIVRDRVTETASYPATEAELKTAHPALLSSRALQELSGWIERTASAYRWRRCSRLLSGQSLRTLRPVLAALTGEDRLAVLRGGLTAKALEFLEWYGGTYVKA